MTTQQVVKRQDGRWWVGEQERDGRQEWRVWPFKRLLMRCPCCGDVSELRPGTMPSDAIATLDPGAELVPDLGQIVAGQARFEPVDVPPTSPHASRRARRRRPGGAS